jgi:hypothetical protein
MPLPVKIWASWMLLSIILAFTNMVIVIVFDLSTSSFPFCLIGFGLAGLTAGAVAAVGTLFILIWSKA